MFISQIINTEILLPLAMYRYKSEIRLKIKFKIIL